MVFWKRPVPVAPAALLAALLVACAPAPAASPQTAQKSEQAEPTAPPQSESATAASSDFQRVLDAAKKEAAEGPLFLSITQPNQEATYNALFDAFNKRFGLNATFEWQSHQQDYYPKVITEAEAGRRIPDVMSGSPDNMTVLDEAGLLESYDWTGTFGQELPGVTDAAERTLPTLQGKSLAHFDVIYTMVYNSSLVSGDEVPRTLEAILDPQWDRKFAINSSGAPLDTLGLAVGKEKMLEFVRKLKANNPVYKRGAPGVVAAVTAGETPIGFGYSTGADVEKAKGAPVEWLPLQDYVPLLQQNVAVLKTAQRPNLAHLFAAWTVSEGMALQEKLEYMGRATARGTPTWERLNELSPEAKIVEVKTAEDSDLRRALGDEIKKIFTQ